MKLKLYLVKNNITIGTLATLLNKSRQAISMKINGRIPFKEREMKQIYEYLKKNDTNLNYEDIFF